MLSDTIYKKKKSENTVNTVTIIITVINMVQMPLFLAFNMLCQCENTTEQYYLDAKHSQQDNGANNTMQHDIRLKGTTAYSFPSY